MSKRKKILFLINNLKSGGAEKVLVNLVNRLDQNKYEITVRTLVNKGENKSHLANHIIYDYVFKRSFRGLNYLYLLPSWFIYNKVVKEEYDLIIVYLQGVLTRIISKAPKEQKTIAYEHGEPLLSPVIKTFKSKEALIRCYDSYNKIIAVSSTIKEQFIKEVGFPNKTKVLYNTFDFKEILKLSRIQLGTSFLNDPESIKLVSVGKLNHNKGYERLIKIMKKLRDEGYNFHLTLVGDGHLFKKFEQIILNYQLSNYISLVGFQSNPYPFIKQSDLFISSSYSEAFSSVVMESVVIGTPVITTETPGMRDILGKNSDYGYIVDNSEEGLYKGIKKILSNPTVLSELKEKTIERTNYFQSQNTVKEVEAVIDNIMKEI